MAAPGLMGAPSLLHAVLEIVQQRVFPRSQEFGIVLLVAIPIKAGPDSPFRRPLKNIVEGRVGRADVRIGAPIPLGVEQGGCSDLAGARPRAEKAAQPVPKLPGGGPSAQFGGCDRERPSSLEMDRARRVSGNRIARRNRRCFYPPDHVAARGVRHEV